MHPLYEFIAEGTITHFVSDFVGELSSVRLDNGLRYLRLLSQVERYSNDFGRRWFTSNVNLLDFYCLVSGTLVCGLLPIMATDYFVLNSD